jgi:F-type H+-transporting ATPase subunit epsilon
MSFRFQLVTPERTLIDADVVSVSMPTADGEVTVLPHHVEMATLIASGVIQFVTTDNKREVVAVSGGFMNVGAGGRVTALTDTAERGEELELSAIEEAKQRAQEAMKKAGSADDQSFAAAAAALERELARYKVAVKHRHMRSLPISEQATIKDEENGV